MQNGQYHQQRERERQRWNETYEEANNEHLDEKSVLRVEPMPDESSME